MKKIISCLLIAFSALALSACDSSSLGTSSGIYIPNINNSVDLTIYDEDEYKTEDETYYKSDYIQFIMSVRGYYQINIPFYVDKDNENLRIYDNMYFYKGDYFQLMSKDYRYIWATLKDEATEYLTPLREQGEDIQVDVKKSGVYKITLDIKTMIMDFEYKSEIQTPYYYPFKTCAVGTLVDNKVVYTNMEENPTNADEFIVKNYEVSAGKLYSFYDKYTHVSNYKFTVNENSKKYISESMYETSVTFNVTGEVNLCVNRKTYEISAEVSDPSKLTYECITYVNGEFITLTPKDPNVPHIFEYKYEATSDVGGYGVVSDDVPDFYNKSYKKYELTVEESSLLGNNKGKYYFKKQGKYVLTIDLLNLTLGVEKEAE
jgi:hypothetical protein